MRAFAQRQRDTRAEPEWARAIRSGASSRGVGVEGGAVANRRNRSGDERRREVRPTRQPPSEARGPPVRAAPSPRGPTAFPRRPSRRSRSECHPRTGSVAHTACPLPRSSRPIAASRTPERSRRPSSTARGRGRTIGDAGRSRRAFSYDHHRPRRDPPQVPAYPLRLEQGPCILRSHTGGCLMPRIDWSYHRPG